MKIVKSKTDQYRHGDEILIARGSTIACPLNMLNRYLDLAKIDLKSEDFLFKPIYRSKKFCANKKLSYTAAKASMVSKLNLVGGSYNFWFALYEIGWCNASCERFLVGER